MEGGFERASWREERRRLWTRILLLISFVETPCLVAQERTEARAMKRDSALLPVPA